MLTEQKIVETAIELADREGIDALSMRRIASELNSGTTSLYRYLNSKDELIELMVDAVYGKTPVPDLPKDWRGGFELIARRFRAVLLRHPWMTQQASRRPALGPNVIARSDHALAIAAMATNDPTKAAMVVEAVTTFVVGWVSAELADQQAQRDSGMTVEQWQASVGEYVGKVVDSGQYPHFNWRILEADDPDFDTRFEFSLDCLLTGLSAVLDRETGSAD